VQVTPINPTLRMGESRQFAAALRNANGQPITGRPITWSSSNNAIATVSQSGLVQTIAPGQATISATADQITGSSGLTVTLIPLKSCALSPGSAKLTVSQQTQPSLTVRDSTDAIVPTTNRTVLWQSDNEVVATVSQTGLITARRAGTARITVSFPQETNGPTCSFNFEAVDARVDAISIQQRTGQIRIGAPRQLTAILYDSTGAPIPGRSPTWSTNTPTVITVSTTGLVTALAEGTARIIARADNVADTVTLPVTKIPVGAVRLTPLQWTMSQGQSKEFIATVEDTTGNAVTDRPLEWLISDPTKVTSQVSGQRITLTGVAPGSVQIQAVAIQENRVSSPATLNILPVAADTIIAPATFTVARQQTLNFSISVRDAAGNTLVGRTVLIGVESPSIANTPAQAVNGNQIQVTGIQTGETFFTLQALSPISNQPEGKITRVRVVVN
jgi:uncharacterized protein YjdB